MRSFVKTKKLEASNQSWAEVMRSYEDTTNFRLWIDVCGNWIAVEGQPPPTGNYVRAVFSSYRGKEDIVGFLDMIDSVTRPKNGQNDYPFELKPETKEDVARDSVGRVLMAKMREEM